MNEFKKLGLSDKIVEVLEKKGYEKPTPIQEQTIPLLLKGEKDVIGKAQTGTGKTACFALPIIEKISKDIPVIQAIILTPTRELAIQVTKEMESLQGDKGFKILSVYGGASIREQLDQLNKGVQVVVGTPGRVMDLMDRNKLNLQHISYAVLDEADEMLNMGFVEDIEEILSKTNKEKKMLFFSATMPKEILKIAKTFMRDYEVVEVENKQSTSDLTKQIYYDIKAKDRVEALYRIMDTTPDFHGIVFCKTRLEVDEVANKLINSNYAAAALHGDVSQSQREKILNLFRERKIKVLVATDVAARGIDVNDLTHVINHSLPQSSETYIHRIGRTGRAGKEGLAITFIIPSEKRRLKFIERIVNKSLIKGTLPSIKEVIEIKKKNLKNKITEILKDENTKKYEDIATALLAENSPEKTVSALLKHIFKTEIESNKYQDISRVSDSDSRDSRDSRGRGFRGGSRGRGSRDRSRGGRPDRRFRERSSDRRPRDGSRSSDNRPRENSGGDRKPRDSRGSRDGRSDGRPKNYSKGSSDNKSKFGSYKKRSDGDSRGRSRPKNRDRRERTN